jgi:Zn-dependent protease with chaperone function
MIGLLEGAVLALTFLAAAALLAVVVFSPRLAPGTRGTPAWRAATARAWLYAPLWLPVVLLACALIPHLVGGFGAGGDHCAAHLSDHQHHLCLIHPPHASQHVLSWALPLSLALTALGVLGHSASKRLAEWRLSRSLVAISRPSSYGDDVRLLDQDAALALTVGWRRPTALLSTGLIAGLSPSALAVVLAHERAHIARRDTWFALFDRFAGSLLPRRTAAPLLDRITVAREQSCDEAAAHAAGGPLAVASALTQVARLGMAVPEAGVSVASGPLEARIRHLLEPAPPASHPWLVPATALLGIAMLGAGPVHTVAEHLITYLLH